MSETVAVIGGGWYGCHIALKLAQSNYQVTLYEAKSGLFQGTSGPFGVRVHAGPHYPRSPVTRFEVQTALKQFTEEYPNMIINHEAVYALGEEDVQGMPPRVDWEKFEQVCLETTNPQKLDLAKRNYKGIFGAYSMFEPSTHVQKPGEFFTKALPLNGVEVILNHKVGQIVPKDDHVLVDGQRFNWAFNCTYYQSFNKKQIFGAKVCYQPAVALLYEDLSEDAQPFSFTVMDGWFPCLMPYVRHGSQRTMLYHAKHTLLGTYDSVQECEDLLASMTDEWVERVIKPNMEDDIVRYVPDFKERFRYDGHIQGIATKLRVKSEFRSALVWSNKRFIHVFSGKLSNICQVWTEVCDIMRHIKDQSAQITRFLARSHSVVADGDRIKLLDKQQSNGHQEKGAVLGRSVSRALHELEDNKDVEDGSCSIALSKQDSMQLRQMARSVTTRRRRDALFQRITSFRK